MAAVMGCLTHSRSRRRKGPRHTRGGGSRSRTPTRTKASPAHPGCRVVVFGIDVGAAWNNVGQVSGEPYVSLTLAHPDLGPRAYKLNLGRAAGQDDDSVYAMI